jgi:hypothetical protein
LSLEGQLDQLEESRPESEEIGNAWDGLAVQSLDNVDMDELAQLEDDDDDVNTSETEGKAKEPSRARLRSLQAVLKTLLESPFIEEKINPNWVRKTVHVKNDFTDKEFEVVAMLANVLRPYVPKRQSSTKGSVAHVALRAPLVLIANAVLRATGYHQFTRETCPSISPSSMHGLILSARGIYEVFCSRQEGQFDITDVAGERLTDGNKVTKIPGNRRHVFGAFFDLATVDKICKSHGLQFADRYVVS